MAALSFLAIAAFHAPMRVCTCFANGRDYIGAGVATTGMKLYAERFIILGPNDSSGERNGIAFAFAGT